MAHKLLFLVWSPQLTSKYVVIRQISAIFKDHLGTNLTSGSGTSPWSQDQDRSDRSWSKTVIALVLTLLQRWKLVLFGVPTKIRVGGEFLG